MNAAEKSAKKAKDFIGKAMKDIRNAESEIADLVDSLPLLCNAPRYLSPILLMLLH